MPALFHLCFVAPAGGTVSTDPGIAGGHLRAGFLRMVERASPALGAELHRSEGPHDLRPYTLSALFAADGSTAVRRLAPGGAARLTVGLLTDELRARLAQAMGSGQHGLEVGGVRLELAGSPLVAAEASYPVLASVDPPRGALGIGFRFASPATFRASGRSLLFPLPSLVFGGLWEKWAAFADGPLPGGLRPRVGEPPPDFDAALDVARYELRTVKLTFRHDGREFPQRAFVGSCTYMPAKTARPEVANAARTLARYAEFAGVGSSTTMGLGRVKA